MSRTRSMNTKTRSLLTVSIAAILSLTLTSFTEIPSAVADEDDGDEDKHFWKKILKFEKNPHFESTQCFVTTAGQGQLGADADCQVNAWFSKNGDELKYRIKIDGMDITGSDGDVSDDVGKLHFHKAMSFMPSGEPMGPQHVLNIYKQPRQDDRDLVIRPTEGILKGVWDDGDAFLEGPLDDQTQKLTEMHEDLCTENIFLMVHGTEVDGDGNPTGAKPGFLKAVLETTPKGDKFCEKRLGIE